MATSSRSESRAWELDAVNGVDEAAPEAISEADQEALAGFAAAWTRGDEDPESTPEAEADVVDWSEPRHHVRTSSEYSANPGIPGRGIVAISAAGVAGCALLDLALTGRISMFFDLCFIVICLVGAMAVSRRDLFTTGVLAPLVFAGVIGVIALVSPTTFSEVGGFGKVFPTGLAQHATALVVGYAIALATVGGRVGARKS